MNLDASSLRHLIEMFGFWGAHLALWAIIFAESGLFFGFFLPGDSLLFTAGFLASQQWLDLRLLLIGSLICAILGDNVGYATGHKFGRRLFQRQDSRFFHRRHLVKAQNFYQRHGQKAIVLARFLPVVRTFAPIVAGISSMNYRRFLTYNILGGALWTLSLTLLGYFLGRWIPDVDTYLVPIILGIITLSFIPALFHVLHERRGHKHREPRH